MKGKPPNNLAQYLKESDSLYLLTEAGLTGKINLNLGGPAFRLSLWSTTCWKVRFN